MRKTFLLTIQNQCDYNAFSHDRFIKTFTLACNSEQHIFQVLLRKACCCFTNQVIADKGADLLLQQTALPVLNNCYLP